MNKRDLARFDKLQRYGCVCCHQMGMHGVPGDIHHIVSNGYRRLSGGHTSTIVLCPFHHRKVIPSHWTKGYVELLSPSLADGSKRFTARWGTQRALLEKVNKEIQS